MVQGTQLGMELIGRAAVDERGRAAGRVIAVIHRTHGTDVLIQRRRWLRSTVRRVPAASIAVLDGGRVVIPSVRPRPAVVPGGIAEPRR